MLMLCWNNVEAVPAKPDLTTFRQPVGELTVDILLKGDERVHWAETPDGYSLVFDDRRCLVYAMRNANGDMVPSPYIATDKEQRTPEVALFLSRTEKHMLFSQNQVDEMLGLWNSIEQAAPGPKAMSDVLGTKMFLVILFAFQDQSFTHTTAEFNALFNQVGYNVNRSTGSVRDYYYDVSHGQFTLSVDIVGPFTGSRNTAYYGDRSGGYQAFAREAVDSAAPHVNFSDYDSDHDGYIDGLHIIFAGHGEEAGAPASAIWSHKSSIANAPSYNRTRINVYSCSPECSGNNNTNLTAIGVICHELGHVFGAPDFYDTDYASSGGQYPGLGTWDIMSSGSWNNGGVTPAHHNAYTKVYIYKWATADTLQQSQQMIMQSVTDNNTDFHRINTNTAGDFFLLENRQQVKWDRNVSGHGLIVYHAHPNANGASVQNYTHPQQLYIMAQGSVIDTFPTSTPSSYGITNSAYAPLPGAGRRDSLTDHSVPWFRPWNKSKNGTPLYYISENDQGEVFFCFKNAIPTPVSLSAEGVTDKKIALQWKAYGNLPVLLQRSALPMEIPNARAQAGDTLSDSSLILYRGTLSSYFDTALEFSTSYHYNLYPILNDSTLGNSISTTASTLGCTASTWLREDFDQNDGAMPSCWISNGGWEVSQTSVTSGSYSLGTITELVPPARRTIRMQAPPMQVDSLNTVLRCRVRSNQLATTDTFRIMVRHDAEADWTEAATLTGDTPNGSADQWTTLCADLGNQSDYALVVFELAASNRHQVYIDDVELISGYLLRVSSTGQGDITPYGDTVIAAGDSITITITPATDYFLHRIYLDGTSQWIGNISDSYSILMNRSHEVNVSLRTRNAISPIADESPLLVYPNPASQYVTIECPTGTNIVMFDLQGRPVLKQTAIETSTLLNVSNVARGIYLLRAGNSTTRIVLQ